MSVSEIGATVFVNAFLISGKSLHACFFDPWETMGS